ncbi:MAG: hypothetical protein AUI14_22310 [Actinobacteria bacterium 13_2_20CM_2_71_6]|nr:MAG: hypothetical protein AUI14_22310 [Actinobacteria bacterium 13_2_20CM_2_71_6]
METAHEVLQALTRRYAFGEVAALVAQGAAGEALTTRDGAQIDQLCAFGQRLLDLDAEDFGNPDAATDANTDHSFADRIAGDAVPAELVNRARRCRMPQDPKERQRGALGSLVPAFGLLLEVIALRWQRRETSAVVAAIHITSEYLPLLAWEPVLGHAGDPARLTAQVTGAGSAWGDFDDKECAHTRPERSAAHKAVRVAHEPGTAWRTYLDRQHSNVAHALAVCAGECRRPCSVVTRHPAEQRKALEQRCRAALAYVDSPIVKLRHSAPVGHGFGVPSAAEVQAAWARSRAELGRLEPAARKEDSYPLPGLPSLFSAVGGTLVRPDTLVADTAAALLRALA